MVAATASSRACRHSSGYCGIVGIGIIAVAAAAAITAATGVFGDASSDTHDTRRSRTLAWLCAAGRYSVQEGRTLGKTAITVVGAATPFTGATIHLCAVAAATTQLHRRYRHHHTPRWWLQCNSSCFHRGNDCCFHCSLDSRWQQPF